MSNTPVPGTGLGEPAALESFEGFYRRAYGDALRLAWFLTGSRAGAEDVLHDAFSGLVVRFEGVELAENAQLAPVGRQWRSELEAQ